MTLCKRYISHRMPLGDPRCPVKFQETMMSLQRCPVGEMHQIHGRILVYSETFEDHLTDLEEVFRQIRKHGLKLSPSKSFYFQRNIKYLGLLSEITEKTWLFTVA